MANEITVTISGRLSNGELTDRVETKKMQIDQSRAAIYEETISATTNETTPSFTALAINAPGRAFIHNLSTANIVYCGPSDGAGSFVNFLQLDPTEMSSIRIDATLASTDIVFQAEDTKTADVLFKVYDV